MIPRYHVPMSHSMPPRQQFWHQQPGRPLGRPDDEQDTTNEARRWRRRVPLKITRERQTNGSMYQALLDP